MKRHKKLALLLILCSIISMFTGCDSVDFKVSINRLNDYISTKVDGSNRTIAQSFTDGRDTINTSLNELKNVFGSLSISSGKANLSVNEVATEMQKNMSSIFEEPLSNGKKLTPLGNSISQALYIDERSINGTYENAYSDGLFAYVLRAITKNVVDSLNSNQATSLTNLNFDGKSASSKEASEVNRALTLLGYGIDKVDVGIIMFDDHSTVKKYNDGANGDINKVAEKFIKENPCMTANASSKNCSCSGTKCFASCHTGGWTLRKDNGDDDTTMTKYTTSGTMMYYLEGVTSHLQGYLITDATKDYEYPVLAKCASHKVDEKCDNCQEIYIYPKLLKIGDDYGYDECMNKDKYKGTLRHFMLKITDGNSEKKERCIRGYALAASRKHWSFCQVTSDEEMFNNPIFWAPIKDENGRITKFAGIIGGIRQVTSTDTPGQKYWALLRIVIDVQYMGTTSNKKWYPAYFDITENLAQATSVTNARYNSYNLFKGKGEASSIVKFVKILQDYASKATLVKIKDDFTGLEYTQATSIKNHLNGLTNTIYLDGKYPFEKAKYNGADVQIDLLDTLTNSEFNADKDAEKIIDVDLFIGSFKLGTLCLKTINPDISGATDAVSVLNQEGLTATARKMQKYRVFTSANINGVNTDGIYLLFGLADIHAVNAFSAIPIEGTSEYSYIPEFRRTGMVYNIFDDGIYTKAGDNKVVQFQTTKDTTGSVVDTGTVSLYDASDILINKRTWSKSDYPSTHEDYTTNSSEFMSYAKKVLHAKSAIQQTQSPFVLNVYLEGLFCPKWVKEEPFVCLGRKLSFTESVFTNEIIGEDTGVFNIYSPDMTRTDIENTQSHRINELLSSTVERKERYTAYDVLGNPTTDATMMVEGILKLKYSKEAEKIRSYVTYDSLDTISTLQEDKIYFGEMLTAKNNSFFFSRPEYGRFAKQERGTEEALGAATPRLYVWCTATSVNNSLPTYLKSPQFALWQSWLKNNGYETYLDAAGKEIDELITDLVHRIESVYDLKFGADEGGKDLIIDTSGLDALEDWVNRQTEQKRNSIIDIILRIASIVLLVYGILLLICYVIDVAVAGEGKGVLKKVTFNRMMTVTGLSKEERKAMTEHNEKGTYTTRATSIGDLIPVVLVLWTIATILIIGSAYNIVDTLINLGKQITEIVRGAIGKE